MGVDDAWAALQFDNAVVYFGTIVENAAQETENVGSDDKPVYRQKYTLRQLLTDDFVIDAGDDDDTDTLMGVDGIMFDEVS